MWSSIKSAAAWALSHVDLYPLLFLSTFLYLWLDSTNEKELVTLKNMVNKSSTFFHGIVFMVLNKDKKGLGKKGNEDPKKFFAENVKNPVTKRFIFVRHGESDWNSIFNKGISGIFKNLVPCLFKELRQWSDPSNSTFLDSPLNQEGIEQAHGLKEFLKSRYNTDPASLTNDKEKKRQEIIDIINGKTGSSIVCASNLRRAIATTTVGLWGRIEHGKEKIWISSHLQEISPNVDTRALAGANQIADLPFERINEICKFADGKQESVGSNRELAFDCSQNSGNKSNINPGKKRMQDFGDWAFDQRKEDTIIIGGHSLWFRYFFDTYLPHDSTFFLRKDKIPNSAVYSLQIQCATGGDGRKTYLIDESSVMEIYVPPSHK